jgi:hypothetical protein
MTMPTLAELETLGPTLKAKECFARSLLKEKKR